MADTGGGFSSVDTGGMTAADYADDENFDQSVEQDKAMAAFGGGDGPDNNQVTFNKNRGITSTNPYGKDGFFSRVFGIDPSKISYAGNFSPDPNKDFAIRQGIANNQFDKFMNPMRDLGQRPGTVRPGLSAGDETAFGTVQSQYTEQTPQEMAARFGAGLLGGPLFGGILSQVGTTENVIAGLSPGFDPQNPRGPQGMLGQAASLLTGGVDPTQATAQAAAGIQSLRDRFAPDTPMPGVMPVSPPDRPARNPDPLAGFEQRIDRVPTGRPAPRPDARIEKYAAPRPDARIERKDPILDVFTRGVGPYLDQSTATPQNPVPQISGFGRPSRGGSIDADRRFASTVDTSNMYDQGGGMYKTTPKQSAYEKVLEMMGIRQGRRGPAAQIFVPNKKTSIFDNINFGGMFN